MPEPTTVGASTIASADASRARRDRWVVLNVHPAVRFWRVSVNVRDAPATTLAVRESPARTRLPGNCGPRGYISKNALCDTRPFWQILRVPICSTVLLPEPSMPANDARAEVSFEPQLTEG